MAATKLKDLPAPSQMIKGDIWMFPILHTVTRVHS